MGGVADSLTVSIIIKFKLAFGVASDPTVRTVLICILLTHLFVYNERFVYNKLLLAVYEYYIFLNFNFLTLKIRTV